MCIYNVVLALHIDTTALSDGTYELIPDSEGGDLEAQANTAVLTEAPVCVDELAKVAVCGSGG